MKDEIYTEGNALRDAKRNGKPVAGSGCDKRRRPVADTVDVPSKRLREEPKLSNGLQDESKQDPLNPCRTNGYRSNLPHALIRLMYQLDLSLLCSLRKLTHECKYPSLTLAFEDSAIDKFNNIVLRRKKRSIRVQIENVDKYYVNNGITYTGLFTKEKERQRFFINTYFDSFVKYRISKLDGSSNDIKYLVVYTNSGLDLAEGRTLKRGRSRNYYPFKFDCMDMEEREILKDFLFTNNKTQGRGFYQFSREKQTRDELLKRLEFSPATQKVMKERNLSEEFEKQMKEAFPDKLVFAVNQPSREELNSIIKSEMEGNSDVNDNYTALLDGMLNNLVAPEKHKKLGNFVSRVTYDFNLLLVCLHDMFSQKHIFSINFEGKSKDISNDITINYKDRITYVKAHNADSDIGYSQLFPSREKGEGNVFSVNKHFALFVEELKNDTRYFIIYTNGDLSLTEEQRLKKGKAKDFSPLKFDNIDIQKKRYKILRNCSYINKNSLYRFAQEETTREKVLGLLKLPPRLQKEKEEGRLSDENENEMKQKFFDRLIFAVKQHDKEKLNSAIRDEMDKPDVPYSHEELREIALRWLESHEFGHITKEIMEKLLEDIKNDRSSYRNVRNRDINEEINFAASVVGSHGTPSFHRFLDFLIKGEGEDCLRVLKRNKIDLANMSSILNRAGNNAVKAFKGLYGLWFDERGNKTRYLEALEKEGINVASMSGILNGAGNNAVDAFKGLHDLWFDEEGNKTFYLKALEDAGLNLANMSRILNGARIRASEVFKGLYDLWFDEKGTKTRYLITLEKEGISLTNMSGILNGAGIKGPATFRDLYSLWFDETGEKTRYLRTLGKGGLNLTDITGILNGAGVKAPSTFRELYDLCFTEDASKAKCLITLEKEGISLANMSGILCRAGANAAKAFKGLYDLWFDADGNKTRYLKTLEEEGINIANMFSILYGAAGNAVKAFKELYDTFCDEQGNKRPRLKHFLGAEDGRKSFTLDNLSSVLNGAGANSQGAFEKLHGVCFNEKGKRTKLLDDFYEANFEASHLSSMLRGTGVRASFTLKRFHGVCFNGQGKRAKLLDDFYEMGFTPCDFCNMFSGAVDDLEKFHAVCTAGETKKYLNRFINKADFTLSGLCSILQGARSNVCSALEDFHNVCFDETGSRAQLLDDFYAAGFTPNDLSHILSRTGNKAASVLRNFHKSCFDERNHLKHFSTRDELFTVRDLSKILHGVGINTCSTFEKLHDLCFDAAGHRTKYLKNLIRNDRDVVIDILYRKVRKSVSG